MAEQERLTNKERRAQAREERKRKEEEARRKEQRNRLKGALVGVVIVALAGVTIFQAFFNTGPTLDGETIELAVSEIEDAREAAGCEVLSEREPLAEAYHFEGGNEPDPDTIYTDTRPTHSGPHLAQINAVSEDGYSSQVSETATTHNLEHGAIIVWYDPDGADSGTVSDIREWNRTLNNSGFREDPRTGAGITSAPYEDPGISSGKTYAFRAWGTAMDCDEWDQDVANGFVAEHYGTRGIAPESFFGPYPEGTIELVGDDGEPIFGGPEVPDDSLDADGAEDDDAGEDDAEPDTDEADTDEDDTDEDDEDDDA